MANIDAYESSTQERLSRDVPYFPFGIQKTCGNTYPRLKLADVRQSPQQGNISLWETHSKKANVARYLLWNEVRACGFLFETPAADGEGPFSRGAYVTLYGMQSGVTESPRDMIVDGMAFPSVVYRDGTRQDAEVLRATYSKKFRECREQTGSSKETCQGVIRKWVSDNTATLGITYSGQEKNETVGLFMLDDRLLWAGREIK
ncbi:hypothetical protein [Falsihalocynthiibacter arcticus]|uniref:hypothetical protein n=1 Tax=Falsihalocynthiibacter arcticus TaxID=1579316 RepID=UPI0012E7AF4C|nr:hypothetical protein [Falsihalocynthiibacter arcticus]